MKLHATPSAPKADAVEETGAQLNAAASNTAVQEELTEARADGASPEAEVPSLLATAASAIPHEAEMEAEFGDLSQVEAHVGGEAGPIVAAMGAEGVAVDGEIAFASEDPSPELVRHELTHLFGAPGGEAADEQAAEAAETASPAEEVAHPAGEHPRIPNERRDPRFRLPTEEVDHAELAEEGKGQAKPLSADKIASAIAFNNKKWTGKYRAQIRETLGAAPPAEGGFTDAEVLQAQAVQLGAGVAPEAADGKIGDTTMAILLQSGLELDLDETGKVNPADVELVFYPGEFEDLDVWKERVAEAKAARPDAPYRALSEPEGTGRMYVKHKGQLVYTMNARGGPPIAVKDFGGHTADPTTAGSHKLGAGHAHVTNAWANSQIPWGAKCRKRQDGEWEFYEPSKKAWKIATGPASQLKTPLDTSTFEDENGGRDTWQINDFGQESFAIQGTAGQYIHTSPADEEAVLKGEEPVLGVSHGCVHVDPADRAELSRLGYLAGGVRLTVKSYETHLLPQKMRDEMTGQDDAP